MMTGRKLVLIGAGGHAKACIEIIESAGDYSVARVVGQESDLGNQILGHKISHTDNDLAELRTEYDFAFIAIGHVHSPEKRIDTHSRLVQLGFQFPTIISPKSTVSRYAEIGSGSIVMNGAILNADCKIGENVIINSASLIEHDVWVGNHCHVSTRVSINGGSKIGNGTFLGSGSVIRNGIEIGENSFVGMGSVITKSLPPNSIQKDYI